MQTSKKVDVGAVIDSAPFLGKPLGIALMMIIIMLTDGFDLFIPSYIAPDMLGDPELGVANRQEIQPFMQAGLLGMAVGSVLLGWLGDRIGRKMAYVACLALMGIGSSFCYFAKSIDALWFWRLVMGFGLGGITPLATTLVSEWTNKRVRSVVVASVIVAVPLGGTLTGFIYRGLVPDYGWRVMFLVGAVVPLALFVLFSWLLPESPKYMAKHSRLHGKLARALNSLVKERRFDGTEEFYVVEQGKQSSNWLATIWNADFRVRTTLIWIAFTVNSFVLYVFTSQIPLLLTQANLSSDDGSMGLQYFSGGSVLGSIGGAVLIGWFGSRLTGTALAALGGLASALVAVVLWSSTPSLAALFILCLLAGASVNGMQAFMYAVGAHSYPTEVRGSAVGAAQTVSRLGAVLAPWVAGVYFGMDPIPSVSAFFLFMAAVICITVISFFLIPTHIPRNSGESAAEARVTADSKT
ncbi:MAG: MFS transporter [Pseudomonadota bacterium]|jgi:AAHS family 4-hydroxybenzoate transporter-like MFS transporter